MDEVGIMNGTNIAGNCSIVSQTTKQQDLTVSKKEITSNDRIQNQTNDKKQQSKITKDDSQQQSPRKKKKKNKASDVRGPNQIVLDQLQKSSYKVADLSEIIDEKFRLSKAYALKVKSLLSDIRYDCTIPFHSEMDHKIYPDGYNHDNFQPIPPNAFTQLISIYDKPIIQRRRRKADVRITKK